MKYWLVAFKKCTLPWSFFSINIVCTGLCPFKYQHVHLERPGSNKKPSVWEPSVLLTTRPLCLHSMYSILKTFTCWIHFLILNIFLSGDSACHIAEKVMRSLNECLGDGRAIAVRYDDSSVLDSLSELSKDELKKGKRKENGKCCYWVCKAGESTI